MTTLWTFLLAPLLVLPMVLLFRFVGCGLIYDFDDFHTSIPKPPPKPEPVPDYRKYIMGRQPNEGSVRHPEVKPKVVDVIGYWRLIDASDSETAVDEKRAFEGIYRTSSDPDLSPGNFRTGQKSLLDSAPELHPRFFNGGFVAIPDTGGLHAGKFTIEAWIDPEFSKGAEHTLFHASGMRPGAATSKAGFRVYATKEREWQVDLEFHGAVFPHPPLIPVGSGRMHLAVIVERDDTAGKTSVTIVINGRHELRHMVNGTYSPPDGAPLLIGVHRENFPDLDPANPDLSGSIQSTLQEVVLHNKALSLNEIENHVDINRAPRVLP